MIRAANNAQTQPGCPPARDQLHLKNFRVERKKTMSFGLRKEDHMDSMDNFRERFEALEHRTAGLARLHWWRGIACGQTRRRRVRWSACLLVAALVVYALAPHPVQANTFLCGPGDVQCLIAAINEANANGQKNTIRLRAGTYTLTAVDNTTEGRQVSGMAVPGLFSSFSLRRLSIGPAMSATMAIKLIERNAHVCFKLITRTMITWKASRSESKNQYGNQLFHFLPLID
jgi:hypothetical protein